MFGLALIMLVALAVGSWLQGRFRRRLGRTLDRKIRKGEEDSLRLWMDASDREPPSEP